MPAARAFCANRPPLLKGFAFPLVRERQHCLGILVQHCYQTRQPLSFRDFSIVFRQIVTDRVADQADASIHLLQQQLHESQRGTGILGHLVPPGMRELLKRPEIHRLGARESELKFARRVQLHKGQQQGAQKDRLSGPGCARHEHVWHRLEVYPASAAHNIDRSR